MFLTQLCAEFGGVRERRWNMERVIVFVIVTLRATPLIKRAREIRARLESRIK